MENPKKFLHTVFNIYLCSILKLHTKISWSPMARWFTNYWLHAGPLHGDYSIGGVDSI